MPHWVDDFNVPAKQRLSFGLYVSFLKTETFGLPVHFIILKKRQSYASFLPFYCQWNQVPCWCTKWGPFERCIIPQPAFHLCNPPFIVQFWSMGQSDTEGKMQHQSGLLNSAMEKDSKVKEANIIRGKTVRQIRVYQEQKSGPKISYLVYHKHNRNLLPVIFIGGKHCDHNGVRDNTNCSQDTFGNNYDVWIGEVSGSVAVVWRTCATVVSHSVAACNIRLHDFLIFPMYWPALLAWLLAMPKQDKHPLQKTCIWWHCTPESSWPLM